MKKLISLVLALAMILVVGAAFATEEPPAATSPSTITITNAAEGETYKAYKILELSHSGNDGEGNPTAYAYTVSEAWKPFFENNPEIVGAVFSIDEQGYVSSPNGSDESGWNATSSLSAFAEAAAKFAQTLTTTISVKAGNSGTAELTTTEPGYYLITSTLGSRAMIDTTPGDVEIKEKNDVDTIEKEVKEDTSGNYGKANDAQIGDTVEFKSNVSIAPRSVNVVIHDTMDDGLTLDSASIKVYADANQSTELDSEMYTITAPGANGETFTIKLDDSYASTITQTEELVILYKAVVNEKAIIVNDNDGTVSAAEIKNKTTVTFGQGSTSIDDGTTTTTHKFSVFKFAKAEPDKHLAGAVFQLYKGESTEPLNLVKIDDNNYRIASENDTNAVSAFETVADGDIVIWGVDSDGDYTLKETEAPNGYNPLNDDITVKVSADDTTRVEAENNTGTELPSTGGIGTTIFYVIGGILLVGAAIVLVARRKAND